MKRYGPCRRCGATVEWARHVTTGSWMPLTRDDDFGRVLVDAHRRAHIFASHAAALDAADRDADGFYGDATYVAHHAVCPERPSNLEREQARAEQQELC